MSSKGVPPPDATPVAPSAAPGTVPADLIGDVIGPYKLLDKIGEGGFGSVWLAERRGEIVQRVALKLIRPGMDSRAIVARFEQERQALAMMDHPSVARVYDAGTASTGRPYFAMEYVAGLPIDEYCTARGTPLAVRLELFAQACEGVHHAHERGIIHRDIKPANILVSEHDGRPQAKVIDFGIAKALAGPLTDKTLVTREGNALGTPFYMSPEQHAGEVSRLGPASDVYSLGVTLFEVASGTLPWKVTENRADDADVMRRVVLGLERRGLAECIDAAQRTRGEGHAPIDRALIHDIETVALRAMDPDPFRRYRSARELAEDCRRAARGERIAAQRDGAAVQAARRVRRALGTNRPMAIVTAMVLGVVLSIVFALAAFRWTSAAGVGEDILARLSGRAGTIAEYDRVRIVDIGTGTGGEALAISVGIEGVSDSDRFSRRRIHAALLRKLTTSGAACVVSDIYFTRPTEHDSVLADAIGDMQRARPQVPFVVASERWWLGDGEQPGASPAIQQPGWARFGGITLPRGYGTRHVDAAVTRDGVRWQPHLVVQAYAQVMAPGSECQIALNTRRGGLDLTFLRVGPDGRLVSAAEPARVPIVEVTNAVGSSQNGLTGGETTALMAVNVPAADARDRAVWTYERALQSSPGDFAAWCAGRVVVLGDSANDIQISDSGEPVPGMYYIAAGIEQLLRRVGVPTLPMGVSLLVLVACVSAGVVVGGALFGWRLVAGTAALVIVLALSCVLLYAAGVVMINPVGPLASVVAGTAASIVCVPRRNGKGFA